MEVIDNLKTLGCEIFVEGDKIKVRSLPGVDPDVSKIQPLMEELRIRKKEALSYLAGRTKFCSWLERNVPLKECNPPYYRFDPGNVKECKHLLAWWRGQLKWLKNNRPELLIPPKERGKNG